ncbi:MAG: MMPL family transporter, partial [Planctomycetes bacterium]|nr:MMPL family transporter [Planctomycetota bacterium]
VRSVVTLSDLPVVEFSGGLPRLTPFRKVAISEGIAEAIAKRPLTRPFLSKDGRAAAFFVGFVAEDRTAVEAAFERTEGRARSLAPAGAELRFVGGDLIQRTIRDLMKRGMVESVGLEILAFLVLLPFIFRSVRGALIPVVSVLVSALIVFSILVRLGETIAIIDVAVPALIVIIGLCDGVHLVHRFESAFAAGKSKSDAVTEAILRVGSACLSTSLTTGLGFASLLIADHLAVRSFGWKAALAVLVTFFVVIVVVPLGLTLWPVRRPSRDRLEGRFKVGLPAPRRVFAATAIVIALAIPGVAMINVDSHVLEEIPEDAEVARNLAWYQERFGGHFRFVVDVTGGLRDPEVFAAIEGLQDDMSRQRGVTGLESYTQWVRAALGDVEGPLGEPQIARALGFIKVSGGRFPRTVLKKDQSEARIIFQTMDLSTRDYLALRDQLDVFARRLPAAVSVEATGYTLFAHESTRLVVTTMVQSLIISLAAIAVFLAFVFRSWSLGLVCLLPNLLPILILLGVNGWLGIPLRIGIVMIYSLGLGLAVDDTIHLVTAFLHERRSGAHANDADAMLAALATTGRALVLTSSILVIGGLCYLGSDLQSLFDFGVLLTVVVIAALAADLWVLPALLLKWAAAQGRRTQRKPV